MWINKHRHPRGFAVVLLVLLSFARAGAGIAQDTANGNGDESFPHASLSRSPDGRYVVKSVKSQDPRLVYSLFLTDMKTGKETLLYQFSRRLDILWSPSSNALALNAWDASDGARHHGSHLDDWRVDRGRA